MPKREAEIRNAVKNFVGIHPAIIVAEFTSDYPEFPMCDIVQYYRYTPGVSGTE